ncbi:MAG: N-acetylmuramoyl-L-alanine amidase [Ruminococcus sp.]|nr:N-acetylmuramoyl-L-alanine amidase [Ruminococcus sp.]
MNKVNRKIFLGTLFFGCSIAAIGAAAVLSDKISENAVLTSLVSQQQELPIIILDAGHGGFDGGCVSVDGVPEKGINLSILLRVRDLLRISGYEVEVTRDSDISIHDSGIEGIANQKSSDMDNRLELFNKYDNAVCISIHQNQFTDPVYNGAQMFYSATDSRNEMLAKSLQSSFQVLQPENKREIKLCGKELFLCYYSENPTVMVECGFLSNPEEASLLNTEEYQQKVAMTIFNGINNFVAGK